MNIYTPGSLINDRYEVASHPLMGGMGIVYLCMDHEEERPVALKTFQSKFLPDREARDRFLREGTAWIELGSHPHIVRCYGVERGDGSEVFLVLEQVAKEQKHDDASLRSWLQTGRPLPIDQALLFALQIARGMKHAATTIPGFVHRDLKPENVLVGADYITGTNINRLRVTDFGLAKVLNTDLGATLGLKSQDVDLMKPTQFTRWAGTALYMSPEQWTGEPVSIATDIYALGCILYEMVSGQFAVMADTIEELEIKHCEGKLTPLRIKLPTDVDKFLKVCLAVNPVDRYADWGRAIIELENVYQKISDKTAPAEETSSDLTRAEQLIIGLGYANLGGSYFEIGKIEAALPYFEKALAIARLQKNEFLEAAALNLLGMSILYLGGLDQGIKYCKQALAISQKTGDRGQEASVLMNLGTAYKNSGNIQLAIEHHEKALKIDREIGDLSGEGNILIALGIAYKNLGNPERAIDYYKKSLEISHKLNDRSMESTVLVNMGIAFKNMNAMQDTIHCYEQALVIDREIGDRAGEGTTLGNIGNTYLQMGDAQKAMPFITQALGIERETGGRRGEGIQTMNLGRAYAVLGDRKQSIIFLEQSISIFEEVGDLNNRADATYVASVIFSENGDINRAIYLAKEALRIWTQIGSPSIKVAKELLTELNKIAKQNKPSFWSELFGTKNTRSIKKLMNKGLTLYQNGNYKEALQYFDAILDVDLHHVDALCNKGVILDDLESYEESLRFYDKALKINPRHTHALNGKGVTLYHLKRFEESVRCYDEVLNIDSRNVDSLNNKGLVLNDLGQKEEAIRHYDKALKINPRYKNALSNKGNSLEELGRYEEAIFSYNQILKIDSRHVNALTGKGVCLSRLGQYDEAIIYYDDVLDIDPRNARAFFHKRVIALIAQGGDLLKKEKFNEAALPFLEALVVDPRNPIALFGKALCLDNLRKEKEAMQSYNEFLVVAPPVKYVTEIEHAHQRIKNLRDK